MALTIEQIQAMITNKEDPRQVLNEIADYLQANPGGEGGGSSYLVYVANMVFPNNSNPTVTVHKDDLGFGSWVKDGNGFYHATSTTPYDAAKIWLGGSGIGNTANILLPVFDFATVVGYVGFGVDVDGGMIRLFVESYLPDGTSVDLDDIMSTTNRVYFPEFRYYE